MTHKNAETQSRRGVLIFFLAFFGVILLVNVGFVYMAVTTQTGVVTEHAYEKGLAFDRYLEQEALQKALPVVEKAVFQNGTLVWTLTFGGKPLTSAQVKAHVVRPVQAGHDFDLALKHVGNGRYESLVKAPFSGAWRAGLEAQWDMHTYQAVLDFTILQE